MTGWDEAGSRVFRVITGVSGSPGSLRALRYAADVARLRGAWLVPVLAWTPPGGELADRQYPSPVLRKVWREAAEAQLAQAVGLAFGAIPDDLRMKTFTIRGQAGPVLVTAACEPGDMIVVGAGARGRLHRLASGRVARYCLASAACPVVAVPPADLASASTGLRRWAFRHDAARPQDALAPAGPR